MNTEPRRAVAKSAVLAAALWGATFAAAPSASAASAVYAVMSSSLPAVLDRTLTAPATAFTLSLWSDAAGPQVMSLNLRVLGDVPTFGMKVTLWQDGNGNGVLEPGTDIQFSTGVFEGPSANISMGSGYLPVTTTTTTFFATISYAGLPAGREFRFGFPEPSDFFLFAGGDFVDFASFPLLTSTATARVRIPAKPADPVNLHPAPRSTPFAGGGVDTGLVAQPGQAVRVVASGTWDGGAGIGVVTASGTATLGGLGAGLRVGALVARVGAAPWVEVGSSATVVATGQGVVYLAMNDLSGSDNAGFVTATLAVLPSTAPKRWVGGWPGFENSASIDANWIGGRPYRGEAVLFDASSYDCDWDIPGITLAGLTVSTAFNRAIEIQRPLGGFFENFVRVTTNAVIAGGTFYLNSQTLEVDGSLVVRNGATFDFGGTEEGFAASFGGRVRVRREVFVSSGAIFRSLDSFPRIEPLTAGTSWQFRVENSTIDVANDGYVTGLSFQALSTATFGPGLTINRLDKPQFFFAGSGTRAIVLRSTSPVSWSFRDWDIGSGGPPVVDASSVAAGSTVTFVDAFNGGAGSPLSQDPAAVLRWKPDRGGANATVSGTVFASNDGNYIVRLTTDPSGRYSSVGQNFGAVVSGGSGAYNFTGTVQTPNTYYLFAFGGSSAMGDPDPQGYRGGLGHAGEFRSRPLFVPSGASLPNQDLFAYGWGAVEGFVMNASTQIGPVRVEAWKGTIGAVTSTRSAVGQGPTYSFDASSGVVNLFAFVDLNRSGFFDPFEASGSSLGVTVPAGGTIAQPADFTISGGSVAPGGLVTLATASVHGGGIGANLFTPMLQLDLTASGADASLGALRVKRAGTAIAGSLLAMAHLDENMDGELQTGATGGDPQLGYFSIGGASSGTIVFNEPLLIKAGSTKRLLVGLDPITTSLSSASLVIESTSDFGLAMGSMALQGIYPIDSGYAETRERIYANTPAYGSGWGGQIAGPEVYVGQQISMGAAGGRWRTSPTAPWTGADGYLGTEGGNTVLPSARLGELIGRVNSFSGPPYYTSGWFRLGGATFPVTVPMDGMLALAINDFENGYFDNAGHLHAKYGVAGSTTGALAVEILYPNAINGTLQVEARTPGQGSKFLTTGTTLGTTSYQVLFTGLPPQSYEVLVDQQANDDFGLSGDRAQVAPGSTASLRALMYPSTGSISGSLTYSGVLLYGNYHIGVTTVTDLRGETAFFGGSSQAFAGAYSINQLPTPATYYLVAFRDGNFNDRPDGTDAFGYHGSAGGSPANLASFLTPIYLSTGANPAGINATLSDSGAIDGVVALAGGATGQVVVAAGRGALGAPGFLFESKTRVPIPTGAATPELYYEVPLLVPATHYSLLAFHDKNLNETLDAGEASFATGPQVAAPAGGRGRQNANLTAVGAPPAPGGVKVSTHAAGVQFSWNLAPGATVYHLRRLDTTVVAQVADPATHYIAALAPNASSEIRLITASGPNGVGPSASFPADVWSAAATPSTLGTGSVTPVSALVSWLANGNPAGTVYELRRGTVPGGPYAPVYQGTALSYADNALVPAGYHEYAVRALNGAGEPSAFSAVASAAPGAGTGLSGTVTYAGAQLGKVVVESFLFSNFTGLTSSVTLPALTVQPWFLAPQGAGPHFVRARKDVLGTGAFTAAADAGTPGSSFSPPAGGIDFTIAVDTVAPAPPAGLTATPGLNSVSLSWAAPTKNADASALADLHGYEVHYTTAPNGFVHVAFTTATAATVGVVAQSGAFAPVRAFVRARDYGLNLSSPTAAVEALPTTGGSIRGEIRNFAGAQGGQFRVRLTTTPAPNAPAVAEATVGSYTFTGLSDGDYFLRAFSDLSGDGVHQPLAEAGGTYGGLVTPFRITIINGNAVSRADAVVCSRQLLVPGTSQQFTLGAGDCPALDKGPGFTTRLFAVPVAMQTAGAVGLGSQVSVALKASYDTEVIVLGPNGAVVARDNTAGGAGLTFTAATTGVYLIEPTSFAGTTGQMTVSLRVDGGFAGVVAGTTSYSGSRPGEVYAQLFNATDSASPIATSSSAAAGPFSFTGVKDGLYTVKAFKDANANGVRDPGEPFGVFGQSVSSPTTIAIAGGFTVPAPPHPIVVADPAAGAMAGGALYRGSQTGAIRVQAGQPACPSCGHFDSPSASTQIYSSGLYALQFLTPATNYIMRAFVDVNANNEPDPLEPVYSTDTLTVTHGSTLTLSFVLEDPGINDFPGSAVLTGTVAYAGSSTSTIMLSFSRDPSFRSIDYVLQLPATGYFEKTGVQGDWNYYMAAFIDANGNNNPDRDEGEPFAVGVASGVTTTPDFFNPPAIAVSSYGVTATSVTLLDPPNGAIHGAATYEGGAPASAKIVVELFQAGTSEPRKARVTRSAGITEYDFSIPYLAAGANLALSAFVDLNGNDRYDFGEPSGYRQGITVSSGAGAFPTYGADITLFDPGFFGAAGGAGEIRLQAAYLGIQSGPVFMRLFDNAEFKGVPVRAVRLDGPPGSGEFEATLQNIEAGTYYADAFRDPSGSGVYQPAIHARGLLNDGAAIVMDSYGGRRHAHGELTDPGAGGSVNKFYGSFAGPGGVRFDGGAGDLAPVIAWSTAPSGGPQAVIVALTDQGDGLGNGLVRYSSAGVMVSSITLPPDDDAVHGFVVDRLGRTLLPGRTESTSDGMFYSTANLRRFNADFTGLAFQDYPGTREFRAVDYSSQTHKLFAAGSDSSQPTTIVVHRIDPDTLVSEASNSYALPDICGGGFCGTRAPALAVHPDGQTVFVYSVVYNDQSGSELHFIHKLNSALAVGMSREVTSLGLPSEGAGLAATPDGGVIAHGVPEDENAALIYKLDSSLQQQAVTSFGPILVKFEGGVNNVRADHADGSVYATYESTGRAGDVTVLRYDPALNLVLRRDFDGLDGAHEDFPFSLAVYDSSTVFVTGALNNGRNLDWLTMKVNMNAPGSPVAPVPEVAITTANAVNYAFSRFSYAGAQATSGTVRTALFVPGDAVPVRRSTAVFGASPAALYNNLLPGSYAAKAFIDKDGDFKAGVLEPVAWPEPFAYAVGVPSVTPPVADLCDRWTVTLGTEVAGSLDATDCRAWSRGGPRQDLYAFAGARGQPFTAELKAIGFYDSHLTLFDPDGEVVMTDDDSAGGGDARVSGFILPKTGLYTVAASGYAGASGAYKLSLRGSSGSLGSIAGRVDYSGTQGGVVRVGAFRATSFSTATQAAFSLLLSTREYLLSGLPTGATYYLGAFVDVNSNGAPDAGEDAAVFGAAGVPAPVLLQEGQDFTGATIVIAPSTASLATAAYVTGVTTYSGVQQGRVILELWSNASFTGSPAATRVIPAGVGPFDAAVPSGRSYYIRAFIDSNNNFLPDPSEPRGVYAPRGEGAEVVYAPLGQTVVGVDMRLDDPGRTAAGAFAGEGTAVVSSAVVVAGQIQSLTITYTAGPNGILAGGQVGFTVPTGFPFPYFTGASFGSSVTATSPAALGAVVYDGPSARVPLNGTLNPGQTVSLHWSNFYGPCAVGMSTITVSAVSTGTAAAQPLFSGSPVVEVRAGVAQTAFLAEPYFSLKAGAMSDPRRLETRDLCGNRVPVSAAKTIELRAKTYGASGFELDATVGLTTSPAVATATAVSVPFAAGQSSQTFFVVSSTTGFRNIEVFSNLAGETTYFFGFTAVPADALTNARLSTAPTGATASTATIALGANGQPNSVFVSFDLGDPNQSWRVLFSSLPFKAGEPITPAWERWGYGRPSAGEISWDGRFSPWINDGARAPNGLYYGRAEISGGGVYDDALRVTIALPQFSGRAFDSGVTPNPPLPGVTLRVYGPAGYFTARTNATGNYDLPGLGAGNYRLEASVPDYAAAVVDMTLNASGQATAYTPRSAGLSVSTNAAGGLDLLLSRAPRLTVRPALEVGVSTQAADLWGTLQVRASTAAGDGQSTVYAPMRLRAGTTTFDDGGQWDPATQQFTTRTQFHFNLPVGTYSVVADLSGFSRSSASVHLGADGALVALNPFQKKSGVRGQVNLAAPHPAGLPVSVVAVPIGTGPASGFASTFIAQGSTYAVYDIGGLDAGAYLLRANTQGLSAATTGPLIVPASGTLTGVDFPNFGAGATLAGTITVGGGAANGTPIFVNAWSPGSFNFGSTVVYTAGGAANYALNGLDAGATYQLYAHIDADGEYDVAGGFPIKVSPPDAALNFTLAPASGAIAGTIHLPPGATDFVNVLLFVKTLASLKPEEVGREFVEVSTTLPNFLCGGVSSATAQGYCAGVSSATFAVQNLNTQTLDIRVLHRTTGQTARQALSVVNGSTTTAVVDLRASTFTLRGAIVNTASHALFNTIPKIVLNAPYRAPDGWPAELSSTTARVTAIRQEFDSYGAAISTTFSPLTSRVGYIADTGTFTITNLPSGAYFVRTENLRSCATCPILVPSVGRLVTVAGADVSSVTLTVGDGHSVSGRITLDADLRDWGVFDISVLNRRREVVRSTSAYLGDQSAGVFENSVVYSFENLPAGEFYTLVVADRRATPKYAGRPLKFPDPALSPNGLQAAVSGQDATLKRAAYIVGRVKDALTGELIGKTNATLLAPNFQITATANPWVEGGFVTAQSSVAGRPIQDDGYFRVGPLVPDITYDLRLAQTSWDPSFLAGGSQNYAPVTIGGLRPQPGESRDAGVIALGQGQSITGVVRSSYTGVALGNIKVVARPSFGDRALTVQSFTNGAGQYSLWVSSTMSSQFDISAAPRDGNLASNGTYYGLATLRSVNLLSRTTADFHLEPLVGAVTGQVVVADAASGGSLSYPFGERRGFPSAAINLQPAGTVPESNPLGDIEAATDERGNFSIPGLSTGIYGLHATSLGYTVFNATVAVGAASYRIFVGSDAPSNDLPGGVMTLTRGAVLTGRILKSDGSAPNSDEIKGVAAANFAAGEFVVGSVETDAVAKTVNSYSISGFKTGVVYDVVLISGQDGKEVSFPVEGDDVSFSAAESTATKSVNLTYKPSRLDCLATAKALDAARSQFAIEVNCTKPLREDTVADANLSQILTVATFTAAGAALTAPNGTGTLSSRLLDSGRRRLTALYAPGTNESRTALRVQAASAELDPTTGQSFRVDKVFDFYAGLDSHADGRVSNANGGSVELPPSTQDEQLGLEERSRIVLSPGTFAVGDDSAAESSVVASPTITVNVTMTKGRDQQLARSLAIASMGYAPAALSVPDNPSSLPAETWAAMSAYRTMASTDSVGGANPLSAFYSIFLPAGIRHQLKERADLTLSYSLVASTSTADDEIQVWFYNAVTGRFELENSNRRLDTVNKTITVSVDHFSTFVVLDSTPVATSTTIFNGAAIEAANFPNPSDCIVHSNITRNSTLFGTGGVHAPFMGTMIRSSIPGPDSLIAPLKINIYTVAGEKIRTIEQGDQPGSRTYYTPWNCANDAGRTVASGVYIGEVVHGGRRRFFKIAIIKGSGL